jgi:hypothetical protein
MLLTAISARHISMPTGYLVFASERRVLRVTFDNEHHAIQQAIGCATVAHGTTLASEDQLLISGKEVAEIPTHRFFACGVPFAFVGNGLLVGSDPIDGSIADRPKMTIDEFQRLIIFPGCADKQKSRVSI